MASSRQPRFFYGYLIVIMAFLVMAVAIGGFNSVGVFFGPLLEEFGWTRAVTSGAVSLAMVFSSLFTMVAGRLTDRLGPRPVLVACGLFYGLGFVMMSQVRAVWQLYLFYGVIMGIASSGTFVPLLSTVARWFVKRRGLMSGIVLMGVGTGVIFMSTLGHWLITGWGWRTAYIVFGILGLTVFIVASLFMSRDPQSRNLQPYGAAEVQLADSFLKPTGFSFPEALRTRQMWMFWIAMFCIGFAEYTILVHIIVHITGLGIAAARAASILPIIGALNIVGRLVIGLTGDRAGNLRAFVISLITMLAAIAWLLFARDLWMFYIFAVVFGLAYGGAFVPSSPITVEFFGLKAHGAIYAVINTGFLLGATAGPVLVGYTYDTTKSYELGFLITAVMSLIGLVLSFLLRRPRAGKVADIE
ncbi:MAG: MFS transporter [Chloroflexi bacterium]|nr:MFS transporter [Chloroflexota bacterium]